MTVEVDGDALTVEVAADSEGGTVTVTDAIGRTATLEISIEVEPSSDAEITAFAIGEATGVITDGAIAVEVPSGTAVTALKATFTASAGATVSVGDVEQESGVTENDFTNAVSYVVTAEDGTTTKTYTVTVTVAE